MGLFMWDVKTGYNSRILTGQQAPTFVKRQVIRRASLTSTFHEPLLTHVTSGVTRVVPHLLVRWKSWTILDGRVLGANRSKDSKADVNSFLAHPARRLRSSSLPVSSSSHQQVHRTTEGKNQSGKQYRGTSVWSYEFHLWQTSAPRDLNLFDTSPSPQRWKKLLWLPFYRFGMRESSGKTSPTSAGWKRRYDWTVLRNTRERKRVIMLMGRPALITLLVLIWRVKSERSSPTEKIKSGRFNGKFLIIYLLPAPATKDLIVVFFLFQVPTLLDFCWLSWRHDSKIFMITNIHFRDW